MRSTVSQPSAVYPEPTRADRAWQLLHVPSTNSLPLSSGLSAHAENAAQSATIKGKLSLLDIVCPPRRARWKRELNTRNILAQCPARRKPEVEQSVELDDVEHRHRAREALEGPFAQRPRFNCPGDAA